MKKDAIQQLLTAAGTCALLLATGCDSSKPTADLTPYSFQNRQVLNLPEHPTAKPKATAKASPETIALARTPVGATLGQYQTLGGIVAEVNGNPIYANTVLKRLRPELSARALEMDEKQFRNFASSEIQKMIQGMERDELVFGAADRNLVGDDRKLAEYRTMEYRTRMISEAGGSAELAQRKFAADDKNFDVDVWDHYRQYMRDVFYWKKIVPRIQITADDMREYYDRNLQTEFTQQDEVTFRLIKIDTRRFPSKDSARKRAEDILAKAKAGDFAEIAHTMNDDARLARTGGEEVPLQRGAYRLEKVEAALWNAKVGQITGIIEDAGGFYIAKVEARKFGHVMPFEDNDTQNKIHNTLWSRQFRTLTEAVEQRLRRESMVRESPEMQAVALEMAMQNYPTWSKPTASAQ